MLLFYHCLLTVLLTPHAAIHGVFNGLDGIVKPVTEKDVAGMEMFQRYQPAELRDLLFSRYKDWDYLER